MDSESKSNAKSYDKKMKTNGFSTANISDRISSMQKRKPNGDWRRFGKLTFSYTTITQLWKFEGKECKILHFCPWGMHETIMKRLSSENVCCNFNVIPEQVKLTLGKNRIEVIKCFITSLIKIYFQKEFTNKLHSNRFFFSKISSCLIHHFKDIFLSLSRCHRGKFFKGEDFIGGFK